jgi:hypothetical protein
MDSDDEEMRDASSSTSGEGAFEDEAAEGVMTLEVTWFQVDLDYEFDAPRWFDLARREEPPLENAAAQHWFASAPDYPPSRASPSPTASSLSTRHVSFSLHRYLVLQMSGFSSLL